MNSNLLISFVFFLICLFYIGVLVFIANQFRDATKNIGKQLGCQFLRVEPNSDVVKLHSSKTIGCDSWAFCTLGGHVLFFRMLNQQKIIALN